MRRRLFSFFVPHRGNDYRPGLLEEHSVVGVLLVIMVIAGFSLIASLVVVRTNFIATVYPSVLVEMVNEERTERNAQPLDMNEKLTEAAQLKAEHMLENDYFAHYSPSGVTPWRWFDEVEYDFTYAGENLAMNFEKSRPINEAWMNSPAHRDNIISEKFTQIGIAAERGELDGQRTTVVVQLFGTPYTSSGQVAAAGQASSGGERRLEVLTHTDTFVAVKRAEGTSTSAVSTAASGADTSTPWYINFVANPAQTASYIFISIAAVLVTVLGSTIVIEVRKQHPRHIAQGGLLLVIVVSFALITTNVAEIVNYYVLI